MYGNRLNEASSGSTPVEEIGIRGILRHWPNVGEYIPQPCLSVYFGRERAVMKKAEPPAIQAQFCYFKKFEIGLFRECAFSSVGRATDF